MRGSYFSRLKIIGLVALSMAATTPLSADEDFHRLRGDADIDVVAPAPPLAPPEKNDQRRRRNYPEQPPTIPHSIAGYEVSLRGNKCLSCHSRQRSVETGAPMVSISHFMDRDLQVLSDISPRRYFCTQCHVPQMLITPPVGNDFIDAADLPAE